MFYTSTPDFGMSTSHLQECMHKNITDKWYLNRTSWLNNTLSLTWLVVCTVLNCSTCCGCQSMVGKARCDTHWRVHVWLSHWGNSHYIGERGCLSLDWPLIQILSWSNRTHARSGDPAAGWAELSCLWNQTAETRQPEGARGSAAVTPDPYWHENTVGLHHVFQEYQIFKWVTHGV